MPEKVLNRAVECIFYGSAAAVRAPRPGGCRLGPMKRAAAAGSITMVRVLAKQAVAVGAALSRQARRGSHAQEFRGLQVRRGDGRAVLTAPQLLMSLLEGCYNRKV